MNKASDEEKVTLWRPEPKYDGAGAAFLRPASAAFSGQFARVKAKARSEFEKTKSPRALLNATVACFLFLLNRSWTLPFPAPPLREKTQFNSFEPSELFPKDGAKYCVPVQQGTVLTL